MQLIIYKVMKLNSNLPSFTGYYGSIFDEPDTYGELQYINEQRSELGLSELENDYDFEYDWEEYYDEMNKAVCNAVEDFLIELGLIKSLKFVKLHSPKFYNFTNDVIEVQIDCNVKAIKEYVNSYLGDFEQYLEDNFKSRDGFSSFYKHDLDYWLNRMKSFKDLDHIEIHAILDFILQQENEFDLVDRVYNWGSAPYLSVKNLDELLTDKF